MNTLGTTKHDVDHFIEKFEAIPEEQWTVETYRYFRDGEVVACCALGHCGARNYEEETVESTAFFKLISQAFGYSPTFINDGKLPRWFRFVGARARILAALYMLRARGW